MKWLAMSAPVLAMLAAGPALAADASCTAVIVEADAAVRAIWPDVIERLREAFDTRDDIDSCARVRLASRKDAVAVEVTLGDGRAATRSVSRREDLAPTLAALLVVPERTPLSVQVEPEPLPPPPAAASRSPARPLAALHDSPLHMSRAPEPAGAGGVGIEFSLTTGACIGDGQAGAGGGIRSFLDIVDWLVGVEARLDSYRRLSGSPSADVLELVLRGGRRFSHGTWALDITAGPALAMLGSTSTSAASSQDMPAGVHPPEAASTHGLTPRMLVSAQLNLGTDAVLRWFLGVNGEFGATHGVGDVLPSFMPRLPSWTVGLALGATVGTL